jgi:[ribosomal protein S18]-alanine N-acetyltransferase
MQLQFTSYSPLDFEDCMAIYASVGGAYFIPENRGEFSGFLGRGDKRYFVGRIDRLAVACGGFYLKQPDLAVLTWGIVHQAYQQRGLGRELLLYRLQAVMEAGAIEIHTSQLTEGFYQRFGFNRTLLIENGFGEGIHEVHMRKHLAG